MDRHAGYGPVGNGVDKDIAWLKPDGDEMTAQEWDNDYPLQGRSLVLLRRIDGQP